MPSAFDPFAQKLDAFSRDLQGDGMVDLLKMVGEEAVRDVDAAIRGDAGSDQAMRGWSHSKPVKITARYEVKASRLEVGPGRQSAGPLRVLEDGRKAYAAGDKRVKGHYTSKKTGARTARTKTVKGRVGATRGKRTWSDATEQIQSTLAEKAQAGFRKMVTRTFGG